MARWKIGLLIVVGVVIAAPLFVLIVGFFSDLEADSQARQEAMLIDDADFPPMFDPEPRRGGIRGHITGGFGNQTVIACLEEWQPSAEPGGDQCHTSSKGARVDELSEGTTGLYFIENLPPGTYYLAVKRVTRRESGTYTITSPLSTAGSIRGLEVEVVADRWTNVRAEES